MTKSKLNIPMSLKKSVLGLLLFLISAQVLHAQTIAAWDFATLSSPATAAATTFNANLVSTSGGNLVTRGPGAVASSAANSFRTTGFQNNGISVTNTDYFQVTLTAALGYTLSLSTIDARLAGTATFAATPGVSSQFAYSLDGINFTLIGSPQQIIGSPQNLTQIDLTTITALQNVAAGTTVTFRYYASGQTATGGWGFNSLAAPGTNGLALGGTIASAGPIPTINTSGTLSALSTIYGTPSSNSIFSISGTDLTAPITVTAPSGFEVSESAGSGFANSINVGGPGNLASTDIYTRLAQNATVAGSPYSGNIVLTSTGAYAVNVPTVSSTVTPLNISTSGATAQNKVYDGNDVAVITGATVTGVNGDALTVSGGGNFSNKNVGTGKTVTGSLSLSGGNASSYTLAQPLLTADITTLDLTVANALAQNKIFDGNTNASITGNLIGVISPDNVTLVGTGNFATSAVGNNIPVTATCTLSGPDAGNYAVIQPTGLTANISPAGLSSQTISFTLSSPVNYGDAPITLNGVATSGLPITYISSDNTIASISGNTLTIHNIGSITVTATQAGDGVTWSPAPNVSQSLTINTKSLTVDNPMGVSRDYDQTTNATFSGTLNGVVGSDDVVLNPTGTFAQSNAGVGIAITATATLSGVDMAKYSLVLPTGLTADITPKPLTILNPVVANKIFDGTVTANLTGTLSGVLSPDVVTLIPSAEFASSAVGNGISVTSTSTLTGAEAPNYVLTQPTGLMANIYPVPTLTENILPLYIQGNTSSNSNRIPYAYRVTISNLLPNATYRYFNTVVTSTDAANSNGAGIILFANAGGFTRSTTGSMNTAGAYNTFVTDANGNYTGWFATEPSGNARFAPGNNVYMRIMLNNGEGGTSVVSRVTTSNFATVVNLTNSVTPANNGAGLYGLSNAIAKNFVFSYDNTNGTGRPLSGSFVESDGSANTVANSYAAFYATNVEGVSGAYGMVIPSVNPNGVRRLEQLDFATASLVGCATDADGVWPGGANTVDPVGGTTHGLTIVDAPLDNCGSTLNLTCMLQGYYLGSGVMDAVLLNQLVSGATSTECDDVTLELHDANSPYGTLYTFNGRISTTGTIACTFPGTVLGNSYYIVVNNRNHMQTWSAAPVLMSGTTSYNFTTAQAQAFGTPGNLVEVETGVWALYSGDINQDLSIDAQDYLILDPDIIDGNSGYLTTDLNGDGSVDALDYLIIDPNISAGVTIQAP